MADLTSYTDTIHPFDSGNTTINRFIVDSSAILVEYTIGKMNFARYAGFQWIVHPPKPFIDISKYDHVVLSFDETTTEEFVVVILQFFTEGFSQLDDRMSWRYFSKELSIKDRQKQYRIPLAEFKTPLWWFNQYKINEMDLNKPDFSRLGMLSVQDGSDATGHHRVLVLKELRFRNLKALFLASGLIAALILYYLCYGIGVVLYKKQKKNKEPVAIPYHELAIDNDTIDEKKKILEYLGSNFSDQNLSLSKMSDDIGVSTVKISSIIKQSYNLSFRQYLNTIRIAEAKRLLQKTKLQISQIAYKVGYTNLTHFCRTFKEVSSVSPNTFRQGISGDEEASVAENDLS
ncbi:MAG: AraC family transcriptional regulator [Fibrobacter sp.]|nr:AraC family transcriptional regulator [Fibrobacter sp.]